MSEEELAYQLFKMMEWSGVIPSRDDFVREQWAERGDGDLVGPCNVDCFCEHTTLGKNYYRVLAAKIGNLLYARP